MKKISIVVPVYNEERTISEVLEKLYNLRLPGWEKEIIVVDDGSADNSKLKAQNAKLQLKTQNLNIFSHEKNLGKGKAIKTALQYATGDYVIIQDADSEYDPDDIPKLLDEAEKYPQAVIYGSRNLRPERQGYRHYVWGVKILTGLTNLLYRSTLTDVYTGYKLFPTKLLKNLDHQSKGFGFEAEVTAKLLKEHIPIREVAIHYYPRKFKEGKKIKARDGLIGAWIIFQNWLR